MTEDSPKGPPTPWDNLKTLGVVMFSVPAAVGLLDKYDEALGLSELLKQVVRNYRAVTEVIWAQIGRIVTLPPDFDVAFWSFFVLILTPVIAEATRNGLSGRKMAWGRPRFWGWASAIAFLGYAVAFALTAELGLALMDFFFFLAVFFPLMTILAVVVPAGLIRKDSSDRRRTAAWVLVFLFGLGVVWVAGRLGDWLFAGLYARLDILPASGPRDFAIFVSLVMAVVFACGNLRAPAYVFFWALGLWMLDTLSSDLLPAVRAVLDTALPPAPEG